MEATSTTQQPDIRPHLHSIWSAVAPGWAEHADYADRRGEAITQALLDMSAIEADERVLELACGPGGAGMAAAERAGEVVLSDVAPEMAEIAAARAAARGLDNVSVRVLDLEEIDEPDASFDVVLCREGLMFAADHARAAREIRRVLRPAGRAAIAVWGPRERNPWLGLVLDSVSEQLGAPVPPPGMPGPFALADAEQLHELLASAGFGRVTVSEADAHMDVPSFDEWWTRTIALAGPLSRILEAQPEDVRDAIRERARAASSTYATPAGLSMPGVSLVALAAH
jgi:SAM-dependent methyltransferase